MQGKSPTPIDEKQQLVQRNEVLVAAREGRAHGRRDDRSLLEFTGEDRQRFLNGLVTCDVGNLQPGQSTYGFFTSIQGKILSDLWVTSFEDSLLLEVPSERADFLLGHVSKYRIADRVDFERSDRANLILFRGERRSTGLSDRRTDEGAESNEVDAAISIPRVVAGIQTEVLWASSSAIAERIAKLDAAGDASIDASAWNCLHVEAGQLRYGVDFDERNFPQETGMDEVGVSYTKGCYLGQEVVARIHYRGGVQRLPRGLRFPSALPEGEELLLDGRVVGRIGATADSPALGRVGLAIVQKRGAEAGTVLMTTDAEKAEVVDLPFVARV